MACCLHVFRALHSSFDSGVAQPHGQIKKNEMVPLITTFVHKGQPDKLIAAVHACAM